MLIEILFDDLTKEKQDEIIAAFGSNMNWDVVPIVVLEVDDN